MIVAEGMTGAWLYEVVKLGLKRLTGEVVKVDGDTATIKQYEGSCKFATWSPALPPVDLSLLHAH